MYLEGVWMSVTPTEDAIIVALDFEGEITYVIPYGFNRILNSTRNRCPQSQAFRSGGHASRSFHDRYF
jgi:hypothetical protein